MAWRQVDSDTLVSNVGSYDLAAIEGGTRFTVTGTFTSRGWRRLIDAPFAWCVRHGPVQRQHAQLAAALKAGRPTLRFERSSLLATPAQRLRGYLRGGCLTITKRLPSRSLAYTRRRRRRDTSVA